MAESYNVEGFGSNSDRPRRHRSFPMARYGSKGQPATRNAHSMKRLPSSEQWLQYMVQAFCVLLLAATPWLYGSVEWSSQNYIAIACGGLLVILLLHVLCCILTTKDVPKIPTISWLFFALAIFSLFQAGEIFPKKGTGFTPSSVALQTWALGESEVPFKNKSLILNDLAIAATGVPCDAKDSQLERLPLSIEPLHTRGAAACLFLCAIFTYVGSAFFSDRKSQLVLLSALTAIGLTIACFGFMGAYSYRTENFLGLKTGASFACFRSKNSAGCYLNVCLAASIGLLTWTLINLRRRDADMRYKVADGTVLMKIRGAIEDFLSDLTTPQIAAIVCTVVIGVSVVVSQCRGAVLAATAAIIATVMLARRKSSSGGNAISPILVVLAALAASMAFKLDENSYERLETLTEFDLESDAVSGRIYIWLVALEAIRYFGVFGSGLGTFHFAYLPFQAPTAPGWFYHAESLYLQIGVELGLLGLAVVLSGAAFVGARILTTVPRGAWKSVTPIRVAGIFLFFSQLVHSSVDFGLILPASFIPACLLLGASLSAIKSAKDVSLRSKDQRSLGKGKATSPGSKLAPIITPIFLLTTGLGGFISKHSLEILSATEALGYRYQSMTSLPLTARESMVLDRLLENWPLSSDALKQSPDALRYLALAVIHDLRLGIIAESSASDWNAAWALTDPILLQFGLDRESSPEEQAKILQAAGGQKAIEAMKNASAWFALAHTKSPLDWRLCWGRARTSLTCSRENMLPLAPPSVQLGQHSTNQLIECSLLFRNQLSETQIDEIWQQAMKTNPSTAISTARIMVDERDLKDLNIDVFPQRSDILRSLATQVFSSAKFPEIHRQLWMRARDLLDKSAMPRSTREVWLADAAKALGEAEVEIQHLRVAVSYEPNNFKLAHRFALKLLEVDEFEEVKGITNRLKRMDPDAREVKDLESKLRAQRNN